MHFILRSRRGYYRSRLAPDCGPADNDSGVDGGGYNSKMADAETTASSTAPAAPSAAEGDAAAVAAVEVPVSRVQRGLHV